MPLIRIDFIRGRSESQVAAIGQSVHRALVESFDVPERDRFQVITEHTPGYLIYDPAYLNVERTDEIVFVQVFFSVGRTIDQKQSFYARVATLLEHTAKVRPEDVVIVLVENKREDWSFGQGVAQYLTLPKDEWK